MGNYQETNKNFKNIEQCKELYIQLQQW